MTALEVTIPTMAWEQIGGDMDPGTYGATIATGDGTALELLKIQPVREYVGDGEAAEVGFPFWTREAYFTADDLDTSKDDVQSALRSCGPDADTLASLTPTQRAVAIAEALLDYGVADEGPAGWSKDILHHEVKWWGGTVEGASYLADEDDAFRREVLLGDLDIDHESYGPDKGAPTSGLRVQASASTVEITEWTDIEDATGEPQPDGEKIVRTDATVDLDDLLDPKGPHRGAYSRDDKSVTFDRVCEMGDEEREAAIVAASIAYMTYAGGDESFVDSVGA